MTRATRLESSMKETLDITEQDLDGLFERYRRSPESRVFVMLADACRKSDRIEEALEICERGITRHPNYASGYVVKGKCLYDLERHEDARRAFEAVLNFDADNLVALKYLGMMEAIAGRYDSARSHLKHILRLDPENPEIVEALKHVDEQRQDDHEVKAPSLREEPDRAVEDDLVASDELATITLADIYASQGYSEKALKIYEEVLTRQPHNETIRRKIAGLTGSAADAEGEHFLDLESDAGGRARGADKAGSGRAEDGGGNEMAGPAESEESAHRQDEDTPVRVRRTQSRPIDEDKNVDHFKRWLEGLQK